MFRLPQKRWRTAPRGGPDVSALSESLGCSAIIAQLLVNRGIRTPEEADAFLRPSFDQLPDPLLLPDAGIAAERIQQALCRREKIAVHGDYDGDGVTSAALWARLLEKLDADVTVFVPHRHRDGYDMQSRFIADAKARGVSLIITTDCGIRQCDEVDEAREAGLDVIVTDHHEPGETLPKALAVINPHRRDSAYPFPHLAGVGVAFRTGEALIRRLGLSVDSYRRAFVDLAAIGTVTDMMPLMRDNRVLVRFGLESLSSSRKPGIRALIEAAGLRNRALTARDIGFGLGPRLNAAGRVDDSDLSLQLLCTRDDAEATRLAAALERANTERRVEQERVLQEALAKAAEQDLEETACFVIHGANWHTGVVGLVANKIVERFNRPAIIVAADEETGMAKGSARSIRPFHLLNAISACSDKLVDFGGHSHAAGLKLTIGDLPEFARAMNRIAREQLRDEDFIPTLDAEMEVDLSELSLRLLEEMRQLEPHGADNPEPLFVTRSAPVQEVRRIGKEQQHLKLFVSAGGPRPLDAILWGGGELAERIHPADVLSLCYRAEINTFNGSSNVQLKLVDLRPVDADPD